MMHLNKLFPISPPDIKGSPTSPATAVNKPWQDVAISSLLFLILNVNLTLCLFFHSLYVKFESSSQYNNKFYFKCFKIHLPSQNLPPPPLFPSDFIKMY